MSERTFLRRFTEASGLPPKAWLQHERLARARELLESTREGLEVLMRLYAFCGNIPPQLAGRTHSCIGRMRSAIHAVEATQRS